MAGPAQQRPRQGRLARPRREDGLEVERPGIAGVDRQHVPRDLQHLPRPTQLAERGGIFAEERQVVGLARETRLEPRQGGGEAVLVADELAAEFQRAGIAGIERQRVIRRVDRLDLLAAGIAQAADVDPELAVVGRILQRPVIGPARRRQVPLGAFEPPEHPPAVALLPRGELPLPEPVARLVERALLHQGIAHRRGDLRAVRAGVQRPAQLGLGGDAVALVERGVGFDHVAGRLGRGRRRQGRADQRRGQAGRERRQPAAEITRGDHTA